MNTIPASSGAVAAHLTSVGGVVQVGFRILSTTVTTGGCWDPFTSLQRRWIASAQSFLRLVMRSVVWAGTGGPQEVPDGHDRRVARVSRQMQRERREVHGCRASEIR